MPGDASWPIRPSKCSKLTPVIGAEIFGVDLSKDLGNQQFKEVHDALMDNLVVFFRDQKMTIEQHKAFGRKFGQLHIHPNAPQEVPDHPELLVIKADEKSKHVAGEEWHTDVSSDPEPPMGSILHLTVVPPDGGGDTMFANMYAAYDKLSEPLKKMIETMTAIHDSAKAHKYRLKQNDRADMKMPSAEHPIVRTHPVTGARRCTSTAASPRASANCPRRRAMPCWKCSTITSRRRSSPAASNGSRTRSPSGTTARRSIARCSITRASGATACA